MKWNAYGKYIHFSHLVLYLCYLGILTSFASGYLKRNQPGGGMDSGAGDVGGNVIHGSLTAVAGGDVNYLDRTQAELPIDLLGIISNRTTSVNNTNSTMAAGEGNSSVNHFIHSTQQQSSSGSSVSTPTSINGSSWVSNNTISRFSLSPSALLLIYHSLFVRVSTQVSLSSVEGVAQSQTKFCI